MKKLLILMILTFMFTLTACGQDFENTEKNNSQLESENSQQPEQDSQPEDNISENTSNNKVIPFRVNSTLPKYNATITYNKENPQSAETLVITEADSGKQIQKIELPENDCFSKEPLHIVDITFDGNFDLLVPRENPASAVYFLGYVWDSNENCFVYAPSFENIANFAIDNANQLILSSRSASMIPSYGMYYYDNDKKDFLLQNSLYWEILDTEQSIHFVEKQLEERELKTIAEFSIAMNDSFDIDTTNPKIAHNFAKGSFWDLNSSKWKFLDLENIYYDKFLKGEISALNKTKKEVTLNDYLGKNYNAYAIYDMNADDVPELLLKTDKGLTTFWIEDNQLTVWREDTPYCRPLNNGAILSERHGSAPEHTDYIYYVPEYNGESLKELAFSKYSPLEFEGKQYPEKYFIHETEISQEVYETLYAPLLTLDDDKIKWVTLTP